MSEPTPPARVCKRDGSLTAFDADRISRSLFAATERSGRADAFLARELADSVVHFLSLDSAGETPSTARIAEVVEQVLEQLGQVELARVYRARPGRGEGSLAALRAAAAAREQSLIGLYTRDLAAAADEGLLVLTGQDAPDELAGCVLGGAVPLGDDLPTALARCRRLVGGLVALDGLEHLPGEPLALAAALADGLQRTRLTGVVNLNVATPPAWAGSLAAGPLFAAAPGLDEARRRARADALLAALLPRIGPRLRIDWHLSADDLAADRARLLAVLEAARTGALALVCDRPRRAVALAEGLDRRHPATLLLVGLNLPLLARQPGMLADPERYLQRLGSLVRLGLSAGVQKRDHIRQVERRRSADEPGLTSGFLLDRARLVVVPLGLDEVVWQMTGWGLANGGPSLELGRQIVQRLREVLDREGRLAQLDVCLDGPAHASLQADPPTRETAAGLTPRDGRASLASQLRAAGALHAITDAGTATLFIEPGCTTADLADAVSRAWRGTEVVRLVAVRPDAAGCSLGASGST